MAKIKQLKELEEKIYPITKGEAVVLENGKNFEQAIGGGTAYSLLMKKSDDDYDFTWGNKFKGWRQVNNTQMNDFNNLPSLGTGFFALFNTATGAVWTNNPTGTTSQLEHWHVIQTQLFDGYGLQICSPVNSTGLYFRHNQAGNWSVWRRLDGSNKEDHSNQFVWDTNYINNTTNFRAIKDNANSFISISGNIRYTTALVTALNSHAWVKIATVPSAIAAPSPTMTACRVGGNYDTVWINLEGANLQLKLATGTLSTSVSDYLSFTLTYAR